MADENTLTLGQAAEVLGVHYMTAYRYVRLGLLDAHRIGRRWAIRPESLEDFKDRGSGAIGEDPAASSGRADWIGRLQQRLLAGDRRGVVGVLDGALAAGSDPIDLHVDIVAPAMTAIGERWADGDIDVAAEHLASVTLEHALEAVNARFTRRGSSRGGIVVGAAPGERHSLPCRLVAHCARLAGFEVADLGADVPSESFATAVSSVDRLVAVGVSATMPDNVDAAQAAVRAIRRRADVPVLLGGASLIDAAHVRSLGGDHWAPDARAAVELFDRLADRHH